MIEVLQAKMVQAEILAEIQLAAMAKPWEADIFAQFLEKPSIHALLAMGEGMPRGFVLAQRAADEAEVLMIATHPSAQRQGVGKSLIVSLSKQIGDEGVKALFLEVAEDNEPAKALYAGCGFVQVGRREDYYQTPEGKKAALLLRLDLVEA